MYSPTAAKYAEALVDVAAETGSEKKVGSELDHFAELLEGSTELRDVMRGPAYPLAVKQGVLREVAESAGLSVTLTNFLLLLVERNRLGQLDEMREAYQRCLDDRAGVVQVDVYSVDELDAKVRERLKATFARLTGRQVRLAFRRDDGLIGGLKIHVESTVYDGSIKAELEGLRRDLAV